MASPLCRSGTCSRIQRRLAGVTGASATPRRIRIAIRDPSVPASAVDAVRVALETAYPRSRPEYAARSAVHVCRVVDGIAVFDGML